MNETLIRSIVTQPPEQNYVYADDYDTLELVRNLVLTKACRILVTAAPTTTTRSLPSPSSPSTTTTPTISTTVNRLGDRTLPTFDGTSVVFYAHDVQLLRDISLLIAQQSNCLLWQPNLCCFT